MWWNFHVNYSNCKTGRISRLLSTMLNLQGCGFGKTFVTIYTMFAFAKSFSSVSFNVQLHAVFIRKVLMAFHKCGQLFCSFTLKIGVLATFSFTFRCNFGCTSIALWASCTSPLRVPCSTTACQRLRKFAPCKKWKKGKLVEILRANP